MIVKILLGVALGFVLYSVWYHKSKSPANDWIETSWAVCTITVGLWILYTLNRYGMPYGLMAAVEVIAGAAVAHRFNAPALRMYAAQVAGPAALVGVLLF